ncbi:ATP-binding protein [Acidovorax sp. A1169]|uniref:HD domain-containing protein n=1 Tax=Acidovorax sp. A1169 TaxID=3059524 RepID=UPI002737DD02|nr:ATP-binding protein [Acidovorax sp. A1169]MDP4075173.1 ATP-binding protein [Acidovorax sp. A1169]
MSDYKKTSLWKKAFDQKNDGFDDKRALLECAYDAFRERVAILLAHIRSEIPSLTIHDITHVDSLWRVGSEIAGADYEINAAEAFVLGGAFLLHDAAHCRAAFSGGIEEIQSMPEWKDAAAQFGIDSSTVKMGSADFQRLLFETLRVFHPRQARRLPFAKWDDGSGNNMYLLPHDDIREAYGDLIGQAAESHWFNPEQLEEFYRVNRSVPICLSPAPWNVNLLKIALLLRVADAAHIDQFRAPRLLMLMSGLSGVSKDHWSFQARMHIPRCEVNTSQLSFTSNPFPISAQAAWWLAYETAMMVDRELLAADHLLRENNLQCFAAREVARVRTPESFAILVPAEGWQPVDASLKIGDVRSVMKKFGGEELYGKKPHLALREILQNARDAVIARRGIGDLEVNEGSILVHLENVNGEDWLHVSDTGVGMSRYVLTQVLLDFGRSLWKDAGVRREWPGLLSKQFNPVGRFGIGFFSIFMLGDHIKVATKRIIRAQQDSHNDFLLEIAEGLDSRPIIRAPSEAERLLKHGTRVSVRLKDKKGLLSIIFGGFDIFSLRQGSGRESLTLHELVGALVPALDIDVYTQEGNESRVKTISAGDWKTISSRELVDRISPHAAKNPSHYRYVNIPLSVENMEEMFDQHGNVVGRAALSGIGSRAFGLNAGVISTGGVLGGEISNFAGIIEGDVPLGLDRSCAKPLVSKDALINWATSQAKKLIKNGRLGLSDSAMLMEMGAEIEGLYIVSKGKVNLRRSEVAEILRGIDFIFIASRRDCEYKADVDLVLKTQYEADFIFLDNVFILNEGIAPNSFITKIQWPRSLLGEESRQPNAVLESLINEVWPDCAVEEDVMASIGVVNGFPINREVTLVYKVGGKRPSLSS